jgi:hypothetical protein
MRLMMSQMAVPLLVVVGLLAVAEQGVVAVLGLGVRVVVVMEVGKGVGVSSRQGKEEESGVAAGKGVWGGSSSSKSCKGRKEGKQRMKGMRQQLLLLGARRRVRMGVTSMQGMVMMMTSSGRILLAHVAFIR